VKILQEKPEFRSLLTEMICSNESDENSPSAAWTNAILFFHLLMLYSTSAEGL